MKKLTLFLAAAFISLMINQTVNAQSCIYCNSNTISGTASAIGAENISSGDYSLAAGYQNEATGKYSFAGGQGSVASNKWAFAYGERATAQGFRSFAQGMDVTAFGGNSVAIGRYVKTTTSNAMVIGIGNDTSNYLENNTNGSLIVGFYSNQATFYVGPSQSSNSFGKVGIGTTNPSKTLEVNGTFKVNNLSYLRTIILDNSDIKNINQLSGDGGLKFKGKTSLTDTQMFLNEEGNLGIGTMEPAAKLQVSDGDIFIDSENRGLILKSPDGQCWKGTADNDGNFILENIDCSLVTEKENPTDISQHNARIFPNPAGNKLSIKIPAGINEAFVNFYNEQGILLRSNDLKAGDNSVSLKKMPKGVLIVKVFNSSGNILSTEKIIHKL